MKIRKEKADAENQPPVDDAAAASEPQASSQKPSPEDNALADSARGATVGSLLGGRFGATLGGVFGLLGSGRSKKGKGYW